MSAWPFLPFDEAVEDASGGNVKTKQNDYLEQGSFAIVDQGKALIAGYTDDPAALCKASLPVVVFGDHTRCLKYVDFPFGMGADGVKILRPSVELNVKFLFHYLRQLKLPDGGYDRHFKYLKRESVPVPPLEEQRRIAAILDQAETLRTRRRQALAQLDSLTQSLFLDMFGAALASKDRVSMGQLVSEFRYGTSEKSGDTGFPALRIPNVASGSLDLNELKTVAVEAAEFERLRLVSGDLLFVRTNGNPDYVGRCAVFEPALVAKTDFEPAEFIYASYLIRARLKGGDLLPLVLQQYLSEGEGRRALRARCKTSAGQYNINTEGLGNIPVPLFPLALQQTFATRIQAIEALKATHRAALAELDALFASLQQRAFSGELTRPASEAAATRATPDLSAMCTLDVKKMLEALIYVAKRTPQHDFYKSLKALYTGDRQHLENHGCLIYGEAYEALDHGPVPKAAYALTKKLEEAASSNLFADDPMSIPLQRTGNQLIPSRDADFGLLTAAERKSLDWAIKYFAPMTFGETKTATHDSAYRATAPNAPIAIEAIIRTLPEAAQRRFFD